MAEIVRIGGRPIIDYTGRDYSGILDALYAQVPEKVPEWADYRNQADFGNVLLQLFAHIGDVLSYYQDRIANESFLSTARTRRSVIDHLKLIGYQMRTASPSATALDVTVPGNTTVAVTLSKGDAFATKSRKDARIIRFEYTRDQPLTIAFGAIKPTPPASRPIGAFLSRRDACSPGRTWPSPTENPASATRCPTPT